MAEQAFVDADAARAAARREIETGPQHDDPLFRAWRGGGAGEPQLVHDLLGRPAYWLVPIQHQETTVGAVRVLGNGRAVASIAYRAGSNPLALNPTQVVEQVEALISKDQGESAGTALLVHDGPPGREAWRVEVRAHDRLVRWMFVTPGGSYTRELENLGQDESLEG